MINILLLFRMAVIVHVTLWKEIWLALAFFSSVSPQEEEERGLTSAIACTAVLPVTRPFSTHESRKTGAMPDYE